MNTEDVMFTNPLRINFRRHDMKYFFAYIYGRKDQQSRYTDHWAVKIIDSIGSLHEVHELNA
jgi:hypothetical protein